jgi:CDP-diacylglycerol--serine O-phosphatidyltransferase
VGKLSKKSIITRAIPALEYFNIANALTTVTVILNILIVYMALQENTKWAFWIYVFVVGIDVFDGKIAKLLKCTTEFGARLDSLCDAVSFCIMPAVIAFFMGFNTPAALVLVILNAAAGMWRLAYFDIKGLAKEGKREYYVGSPTTRTDAIFFIGLTLAGLFREYINVFFYAFFIVSPVIMLANIKIEKVGLFAKVLYVVVPLTSVAYLFIW